MIPLHALSFDASWEPISHLRGGTEHTNAPNQTNFVVDSTSIYIMCIYIYLSNAYGNLDTRVNIYLWAEGHISVPLREQIHMKSLSGLTGP